MSVGLDQFQATSLTPFPLNNGEDVGCDEDGTKREIKVLNCSATCKTHAHSPAGHQITLSRF
jgi:hypothetical protein